MSDLAVIALLVFALGIGVLVGIIVALVAVQRDDEEMIAEWQAASGAFSRCSRVVDHGTWR